MEPLLCCRTCLSVQKLNPIFLLEEHKEKYSNILLTVIGIEVELNDSLPRFMCTDCISQINNYYRFRKKCEDTQRLLKTHEISKKIKLEPSFEDKYISIDISELINYNDNENIEAEKIEIIYETDNTFNDNEIKSNETITEEHTHKNTNDKVNIKGTEAKVTDYKGQPTDLKQKPRKRKVKANEQKPEKKEKVKEQIECEYCHKILTSKLSLRNHYKIHTGFDVVCEHCGKKFITRRLLLMHCKAKHGYEKTDKCSFCDYRASNAEQVKIHERLHTGEKPYVCGECGAGFHRNSCYLQHIAIHLPDKTVQCDLCPARFKSVTLMRIHRSRHRAPQYIYKCRICDHNFARRRNVARHLLRIHSLQPLSEHIDRSKCV